MKSGKGKLSILEDTPTGPMETMPLEFDGDIYGNDWIRYAIRFNTNDLTGVGIAICDLGGSVLLDNMRLFRVADATEVADPYKDQTGSTVAPPTATVKPTIQSTTRPTGGVVGTTQPTDAVVDPTQPEDPTDPTQPVDPTAPTDPAPSQDDVTDPTAPAEEDEDTSVDTSTEKKPNPVVLWVSIAVAVLVLAAGGVTAFLLLKKKNRK